MTLEAFLDLSTDVGRDPLHIQGSGGNTSMKDGSVMWIKASGMCLRDSSSKDIFCSVDRTSGLPVNSDCGYNSELRPSIETVLHSSLPHKYVFHTHSTLAIAASLSDYAFTRAHPLHSAIYIPYVDPGSNLANAIKDSSAFRNNNVYLLENHGLVFASNSLPEIKSFFLNLSDYSELHPRNFPPPDFSILNNIISIYPELSIPKSNSVHALATDPFCFSMASTCNPPTPDHLIFCGIRPVVTSSSSPVLNNIPKNVMYVLIKDVGVLLTPNSTMYTCEMLESLSDIYRRCPSDSSIRCLSDITCQGLLGWESESYRLALATGI